MALLGAFIGGKAGEKLRWIVMMPESAVVDGNPQRTAETAYVEALRRHLEAETAELVETEREALLGPKWTSRHYLMKGGARCGDVGCEARAKFFSTASDRKALQAQIADPQLVGASAVYVFPPYSADAAPEMRLANDTSPRFRPLGRDEYVRFVKLLSPWFYIYLPGEVNLLINSERVLPLVK